jgi:hypothetical protein
MQIGNKARVLSFRFKGRFFWQRGFKFCREICREFSPLASTRGLVQRPRVVTEVTQPPNSKTRWSIRPMSRHTGISAKAFA